MQYEYRGEKSGEYELFMRKVLRGVSAGYGDLSAAQCGEVVAAAVPLFERYRGQGGSTGFGGRLCVCGGDGGTEQVRLGAFVGEGCERVGGHGDDTVGHGDERQGAGSGGTDGGSKGFLSFVDVSSRAVSESLNGEEAGVNVSEAGDAVKGKNWKKNRRKKVNRRGRVNVDTGPDLGSRSGLDGGSEINVDTGSWRVSQGVGFSEKVSLPKDALRLSLEKKWALENELKAAKAARELELLKAEDLDAVKKLRERKVQGATERTMVQIEKAHASLVQTGNVPGVRPVQQGFCQTVVDGEVVESVPGLSGGESKECSISPSSSISEREVRQLKKDFEDLKRENEMLKRCEKRMGLAYDVLAGKEHVAVSVVDGSVPESARQALDKVCGKGDWEAVGDLDMDPDTLYLQMDYSNKFDYGGCY